MIILLLGTHLYLTVRLKFPQRRIFKAIRLSIQKDDGSPGDVSQFGALATSLAATIGTGNIVGVATAVATPTMLPVPMVAASEVASAPNWLTSPGEPSSFWMLRRMALKMRRWGNFNLTVR